MKEELNITQKKILKVLAANDDEWFTFDEIVRLSGVNRLNAERAINKLQNEDYVFVTYEGLVQVSPDGESASF